jgi:hypothetical protein
MQTINTSADLKNTIQQLEQKQAAEWLLLKGGLLDTYESLKLVNMLKRTFSEVATVPDLKTNVINAAIGLTTGIVTKKILIGKTLNPLKKLLGIIVEVAVAGKVAQNADGIKSIGNMIMKKIFNQRNDSVKV